ncbi:MAG: methyltransferase domain-containing protein [Gemmataceae bacterium]
MAKLNYLNLGCGRSFHPDWVNVDHIPADRSVIQHDLGRGVPFKDETFDVVYHSHILEHFARPDGERFIDECRRVLKKGGVLRIAVPDLEQVARLYLRCLDQTADQSSLQAEANYDWMTLELLDQCVRARPGGEMLPYLQRDAAPNRDFVVGRIGWEAHAAVERSRRPPTRGERARAFFRLPFGAKVRRAWDAVIGRLLFGRARRYYEAGRHRLSGEVHQWMYDRFSLKRLLTKCGFQDVRQCAATASAIPDWRSFALDTYPDGAARKPDSLYMEGTK